jgi:hypothetical protein
MLMMGSCQFENRGHSGGCDRLDSVPQRQHGSYGGKCEWLPVAAYSSELVRSCPIEKIKDEGTAALSGPRRKINSVVNVG